MENVEEKAVFWLCRQPRDQRIHGHSTAGAKGSLMPLAPPQPPWSLTCRGCSEYEWGMGSFFKNLAWFLVATTELWWRFAWARLKVVLDSVGLIKLPSDLGEIFGGAGISPLGFFLLVIALLGVYLTNREFWHDLVQKRHGNPVQGEKVSLPALGMLLCVVGFIVCAIFYWTQTSLPVPRNVSASPQPLPPPPIEIPSQSAAEKDVPNVKEPANRTPRQLLALYEGRTPFQADKLIEPFKGLWVESDGEIRNVLPDGRPGHSIAVLKTGNDTVECRFGPEWANHLGRFDIGESIKFRGKISPSQNGSQLYLSECEIVANGRSEIRAVEQTRAPWELVFPAEANLDHKQSLFVRSWTELPSGNPIERRFSRHQLFLGVDNPPNSRTLRNLRVVIEAVSNPPHVTSLFCLCDSTRTNRTDVHPGATEYFLIGEGFDESHRGMHSPRIVNLEEYRSTLAHLKEQDRLHIGFTLLLANGHQIPLLRNDGIELNVTAYADDVPPVSVVLVLNTRTRIEMYVKSQNTLSS